MKVREAEREFLVTEALALAEGLPEGEARVAYQEIAWAADQGEVPEDLSDRVGQLIAVAVETGRARSIHGPAGVRALLSVWRDTPQGRRATEQAEDLTAALHALRGRAVESIRIVAAGPGAHTLTVAAGDVEVRLSLDRSGATLRSVNVGGGGVGE